MYQSRVLYDQREVQGYIKWVHYRASPLDPIYLLPQVVDLSETCLLGQTERSVSAYALI